MPSNEEMLERAEVKLRALEQLAAERDAERKRAEAAEARLADAERLLRVIFEEAHGGIDERGNPICPRCYAVVGVVDDFLLAAGPPAAPPPEPQSEKPYLLAACPFCGNSNPGTLFVETVGELCSGHCDECCASGPEFETADEAIAAWNRAAPPVDPLVERVVEVGEKMGKAWATIDRETEHCAREPGCNGSLELKLTLCVFGEELMPELVAAVAALRASRAEAPAGEEQDG
jgi:hypothetical protein